MSAMIEPLETVIRYTDVTIGPIEGDKCSILSTTKSGNAGTTS